MTLRTKLILAFLLLSVVPLAGITLYSYGSSVRAFHEAVRSEADAMTHEMGSRVERIAKDIDARVGALGDLPYDAILAREGAKGAGGAMAPPAQDDAGDFVTGLLARMGDVAPLVEALEFQPDLPDALDPLPAPAPPAPGEGAAPPAPPEAPFVIDLSTLWHVETDGTVDAPEAGATKVVRLGKVAVLFPRAPGAPVDVASPDVATIIETVGHYTALAVRMAESGDLERVAEQIGLEVEARARAIGEGEVPPGEVVRELVERFRAKAGTAPARPKLELEGDFEAPVRRGGAVVGRVTARVDHRRVLESALAGAGEREGEIPFAIDRDGNVYTAEPGQRETILALGPLASSGEPGQAPVRIAGDWAVATHDDPGLGLVFGIARPIGQSLAEIRRATGRNLAWGLGLVGLAMLGVVPLSTRMTRDLTVLAGGVERLGGGDLGARVAIDGRDEIGKLGRAFNRMAAQLGEHQARLLTEERLRRELEMCRQIQEELLPEYEARLRFAEVRAVSIPARELGGDFFNYFALGDGSVALLMGDVSGKGVPAALLMATLQATLRARLPMERDLAVLADALDREIESTTPREAYLTLFVGVIDPAGKSLRYVNAGHNPQYLYGPDGRLERLGSCGRPMGLLAGGGYTEREVALRDGDSLCLFTDGLVEAESARGEAFGEERLERLLRDGAADRPDRVVQRVEEAVRTHRGTTAAADDATMLVLRIETAAGTA